MVRFFEPNVARMNADIDAYGIPREPVKRRAWIIMEPRYRHQSVRRFAGRIGVSPSSVHGAIDRPSAHIETAIADSLGVPASVLWPERYDSTGRRHDVRPPKRSKSSDLPHVHSAGMEQA